MALVKHNNNSISSITTPGSLAQGKMILISEQTASGSASISFTSGIDSTYPIYKFEFINIHPSVARDTFQFQTDTGTNTNYNITCTSTFFQSYHDEADAITGLEYQTTWDAAQSTSNINLTIQFNDDNDASSSGEIFIFNPSSDTYIKHWIAKMNLMYETSGGLPYNINTFVAGYFNTTTPLTRFRFKMSSGNIDSGKIKLYGIGD